MLGFLASTTKKDTKKVKRNDIYTIASLDVVNVIWNFVYKSVSNNDCNFSYDFNANVSNF